MFGSSRTELSSTARALLAAERQQGEDEELKTRALERAKAALDGERWSGVALRPTNTRPRSLRMALLVAAALSLGGLAMAGAHWAASDSPTPLVVLTVQPQSVPAGAAEPKPALEPKPVAEPASEPAVIAAAPSSTAHARPSGVRQYALEVSLLEPARTGIARGDYHAALGAIAKHQREYASGQLAEEREALRVRALWGLGQKPAAEAAAAVFRKRYPRSGLLSWMKAQPAP